MRRTTPPMRPSSNQIRSPLRTACSASGSVQATVATATRFLAEPSLALWPCPWRTRRRVSPRRKFKRPSGTGRSASPVSCTSSAAPMQPEASLVRQVHGTLRLDEHPLVARGQHGEPASAGAGIDEVDLIARSRARQAMPRRRRRARSRPVPARRRPGGEGRGESDEVTMPSALRSGFNFSTAASAAIGPVRSFGPARSIRTLTERPLAAATRRTRAAIATQSAAPSCAQLMRATSMPPRTRASTSPSSTAAALGSVTMMRVRCLPERATEQGFGPALQRPHVLRRAEGLDRCRAWHVPPADGGCPAPCPGWPGPVVRRVRATRRRCPPVAPALCAGRNCASPGSAPGCARSRRRQRPVRRGAAPDGTRTRSSTRATPATRRSAFPLRAGPTPLRRLASCRFRSLLSSLESLHTDCGSTVTDVNACRVRFRLCRVTRAANRCCCLPAGFLGRRRPVLGADRPTQPDSRPRTR